MVVLREGDYVWVDTSIGVPIGAEVQFADSGQLVLIDDEGKEHKINNKDASFKPMHPTSVKGVDDMIQLGDLNEAGLLRNLYIRHKEGIIYTYTGSILVAVNPYQLLPIYTLDQVEMYTDRRLGELPPHVFAIADSCFFNMRRSHKNQCCIISGESGAGKTESTKLMLQFLAAVSGQHSWIEQQVLEANSILEAFGNAKTVRNDNSSRFGKYIDIHFTKGGVIEGARVDQYLLEKSRVCRQGPDERNYHIFYCMLLGMSSEEKNLLSLGTPAQYNYLISEQGNCTSCEGRDDIMEYAHIRSAMKILAFTDNDSWEINKLLASILHMGNVTFDAIVSNNLEGCHVESSTHFNMAAKLLEVDSMALADSLTHRSFMTTRESVTKSLSAEQAMDGRDAFAKAIYGKLFVWIVEKINSAVYKPPSDDSNYFGRSIGLLDIFGFENFKQNSFEQLCINFANEQLQQFFVKHVFKLEQEEYARENIVWKHIDFNDNQKTLDVLANKSVNILALIDEESHFPKGTDITMLNKMNQVHGQSNVYIPPKNNHETQFGIHHFAGVVYYDSIGFLEKNRDALSSDLINLVETSSNKLLKLIFQNELSSNEVVKVSNPKLIITRRNSLMQTGDLTKKRVPTLSGQFRQSLEALMKTLTACQPYFIRCIKPNDYKKPLLFDRELCMRQLRYSGMMETIRIRKAGYPIRHSFDEFLARYRTLLNSAVCNPKVESPRRCSESICMNILTSAEDWKVGKTKVFLKDYHDTMLELARDRALNKKVLIIQRVLKGYKYRRDFLKKRSAAVVLQKHWRAYKGKKLYRVVQLGFARLQAKVRARQLCHQYQQRREATVVLQTHVRGHLARKEWNRKRQAVILLQAHTRGMLARRAMNKRKKDALLTAQERRAEEAALRERQRKLDEVLRQKKEREEAAKAQAMTDQEMVNEIFEFLPQEVEGQDQGQAPQAFKDLEEKRMVLEEVDLDETPIMEAPQEEEFDDLDEYSFNKFASMYFQGAATPTHLRQRLQEPLLFHEDENDTLASLNVWWIILRFMGDLPEPRPQQGTEQRVREHDNSMIGENATLDRPLSTLEKVHIIVRYAIVRPNLRDEILCQICKQLQENRNKNSYFRGWVLLSICLGIFPPSTRFIKYLQSFLRFGPVGYAPYCTERLRRTVANGVRGEPPSWLELQASQTKKPISVSVTLMDGRTVSLPVDSASNSKEVCQVLSQRFNIKDTFGFSLYAAIYDKVWSLGSGREHVMDAISQSEQEVRRKGGQEQHAPWRLYFRKEIFTPWHDCSFDNVSTDLIYKQVIRGLKYGEYRCDKEDDYVQLAVKHYYVLHGSNASAANAKNVVQECINTKLVESKTEARWVQLVSSSHAQCPYITSKTKPEKVKAETVDYARKKWPMLFSRFYEVAKVSGPALPKNMFILAINWTGITFLDERERKFLEVSYPEITGVSTVRDPKSFGQSVSLHTLKGDFILSAVMATDITDLITTFLAGLKERSHYAVALQESNRPDDPTILSFKKGELILLIKDDDYSAERGWVKGQSERTGKTGAVPLEAILILPTITKPTNEVMSLINLSPDQRKNIINSTIRGTVAERLAPASLKEYSIEYFRQPTVDVNRQVIAKNSAPERLWMSSKEPIRQPLLKRLVGNAEFTQQACRAFTAILKYMGDYPTRQVQNPMELTDQIFGPPTKNEAMRDEIYCQIMKQMTNNQGRYSMDQGWQLLWLCCGLFPPSNSLLKHAQRFIESRRLDPLASDCLQRLQGALRVEPRKLPPHQLEVNAIQQDSTQILHKIFFPNDDGEIFEIGTNTRVRDLIRTIASKLKLVSDEGFSLFVKTPNKVLSMNDADYFFDSLRHITDWMKQIKGVKEGEPVSMPYTVFFMRKLWFNMNPGKDLVADLVFHYPQEMPKYLRGYHHCSKEEMVQLAALLFRVKVNNDKTQFVTIPKMLKELVPSDQLKAMSTDEWKKSIVASYNKQGDMTVQDAMVAFLKVVSKWPTFGCAFFEVKQTSEPAFPDIVRIAINRLGVTIIRPKDKVVLATHPYNTIANWCSGSTYFHMTIGSLVKGTKLLCETSLGYKMDDLLTSYVNMYKKKAVGHRIRRYD